jgi:hypothetical protein
MRPVDINWSLRYGIAATAQRSGRQVGRLFPAFPWNPAGGVASIDARAAVHTAAALLGNRDARPATLGTAAPIHSGAPVHQGAALWCATPLATGMGNRSRHAA